MIGVFIQPGTHTRLYGVLEMGNIIYNEIIDISQGFLHLVIPSTFIQGNKSI